MTMLPSIRKTLPLLLVLLALTSGCAFKKAMKAGDGHMHSQRWSQALASYEKAIRLKPQSMEAQAKVTEAQGKLFEASAASAHAAMQRGDYRGAVVAGAEVFSRLPASPARDELINGIAAGVNTQIDRDLAAGEFRGALQLIDAAGAGLPPWTAAMTTRRTEAVALWVQSLETLAEAARISGRPGDAILCVAKIAQLTGAPEHAARRDQLRRQLDDSLRYVIQPRGKVRDKGFMAVAPLLTVRDPGPLLQVLGPREKGRAAAKLSVTLGSPRFSASQTRGTKSAEYQSGTKQVPNPSFKTAEDKVTSEERRLNDAEGEVMKQTEYVEKYGDDVAREGASPNTSTGAEQNLSNAKSRLEAARRKVQDQRGQLQQARESLRRVEQFKEEPVFSTHTYTVVTHTLQAQVRLFGSIEHSDGRPALGFNFTLETSASDDTHPIQHIAKIGADPLTLPSKSELSSRLWKDAQTKIEASILQSFQAYRQRFLDAARAATTEAEVIEGLVTYILLDPGSVEPEAVNRLAQLRRIEGADALLSLRPAPTPTG